MERFLKNVEKPSSNEVEIDLDKLKLSANSVGICYNFGY